MKRYNRPAHCEPGSMEHKTQELGERLRLSRERLMASDLNRNTRAWRLWAACVDATVGYTREADQTYVVGLARRAGMERQVASQLLQRFNELGVFAWRSGPRGSHTPGMLALPSGGHSGTMSEASGGQSDTMSKASGGHSGTMSRPAQGVNVTPLHSDVESMTHEVSIDNGTQGSGTSGTPGHRSPLIAPQDNAVEGSEAQKDWEAEREARPQARPGPELQAALEGLSVDELLALAWRDPEAVPTIRAEMERREAEPDPYADLSPATRRHFGPDNPDAWNADERTGDGVGDDEAAQLRWQGDNPAKARARRG